MEGHIIESIDLLCNSMDLFLYDRDVRHEELKLITVFRKKEPLQTFKRILNTPVADQNQ